MLELLSNVPHNAIFLLTVWAFFILLSIYLFFKNIPYWKFSLFFAAFCIAAAFALFSPFLYVWDEQFHALVAKNCMTDPFHPKLLNTDPIGQNSNDWIMTTTWLHKQPLFTWLMALSMKLFGVSTFSVRLPSVLFHAIMTLVICRVGTLIFSKKVGFISALLFMHSAYLLGLVSGRIGTDHNDYIFMSFIGLSFWAYFEWRETNLKKWVIWIGVFVACAVLTKWLVGLLVFFGWGCVFLIEWFRYKNYSQLIPMIQSLVIAIILFIPWQIYTFLRFPELAKKEMVYNSKHIWEPVEGHVGDGFYHYDQLTELYFDKVIFLSVVVLSIIFLFLRKTEWRKQLFILSNIFVVYFFFTLVQTKMPSFPIPVYPLLILLISYGIVETANLVKNKIFRLLILTYSILLVINAFLKPIETLEVYGFKPNTEDQINNQMYRIQAEFIRSNASSKKNRVVFGVELRGAAFGSWMFYTNDIAYHFYPDMETVDKLIKDGYEVVLIDWNNSIPEALKGDQRIKVLIYPD